jgi:peptidoglycan-N-acetylglucosamine deacetylase
MELPGRCIILEKIDESISLLEQNNFTWIDWNAANGDGLLDSAPKTAKDTLDYHKRSLNLYPHSNIRVIHMHDSSNK